MENRWNMLDSYSEGQEIFGRDEEIAQISESIVDNIQTFVYGKSGIGKTSLIQAGVFPELRKRKFFPVIIRLAFFENEDLKKVVIRLVQEEASREDLSINKEVINYKSIDESDLSECSLYEYFSKTSFTDTDGNQQIPVLIFDQFEETINNEDNWQRTVDFLKDELYNLLDDSIAIRGRYLDYTNFRIVISMREDYLYCLEDIVDQFCLWELRYNRFRVKSLSEERAYEVISRTCGEDGLEINHRDKIIRTIIKIVKINSGSRFTEINTALLSLICSLLSENAADGCIKYQDLRNINSYLSSYYDNMCEVVGSKAVRYLENRLITKDGRRSSVDEAEALSSNKITQNKLDYLVDRKLLRRIKTDATSTRYEYIHDLFAKMVFKRRSENKRYFYLPDYRNFSKKLNLTVFIRRFAITTISVAIISFVFVYYHEWQVHGLTTFNLYDTFSARCCSPVYLSVTLLLLYWLPLLVQRYHDSHHSGWLLLLFPFSAILMCSEHFIPTLYGFSTSLYVVGLVLAALAFSVLFFPSKQGNYTRRCSLGYESICKIIPTTNIDYLKGLSLECLWLALGCFFTDVLSFGLSNRSVWTIFSRRMELPILNALFNLKIYVLPCISLLPIGLLFSPSLKSRLKQLGYSPGLALIPYLNILLAIACIVPDNWLNAIGLTRITKANKQEDIFVVINDELRSMTKLSKRTYSWLMLKCLFIPFYFLNYGLKKKAKIGERISAFLTGLIQMYALSCILFFMAESRESDFCLILLLITVILFFFCCVYIISLSAKSGQAILDFVEDHPEYTISEIAANMALADKRVEAVINEYVKKGKIFRIEKDGVVIWQVNKNQNNIDHDRDQ